MPSLLPLLRTPRRALLLSTMLAGLTAVAACGDDDTPTGTDPEPEVATFVITAGTSSVTVDVESGAQTGGPLALTVSQANPITVRFLRANGQDDPLVNTQDFRLDITTPPSITFARGSGTTFTGTLTPTETGAFQISVSLFHLGEGHAEFTRPVSVNVTT